MAVSDCTSDTSTLCLKNAPNLASCSFDKHGLILIIFLANGISTLSKVMCLFNFPCPFTYAYFLLLNSSDGNDAKRNMFYAVGCLLVALSIDPQLCR